MKPDLHTLLTKDLRLPEDGLLPDTALEGAGLDSLALVELATLLSERFDLAISEDQMKKARTVGELTDLIDSHLQYPGGRR